MKNLCLTTLMLAALAAIAAVPAAAQLHDRVEFSSPFAFTAGMATLPAGQYTITKQGDNSGIYVISNRNGGVAVMVIAHPGEQAAPTSRPNVSFNPRDGRYYLETVALADGSVLAINNPSPAEGKAALMVRKVRMVK